MELVLSVVALASFLSLIVAWVAVPHAGSSMAARESAHEAPAARILTAH